MIRYFSICVVGLFLKLFYHHKTYRKGPRPEGGGIIASNHASFLDPPIVGVSYWKKAHFLGRETLFRKKVFAWLIRQLNTHPVVRGKENASTFKLILSLLRQGQKVVLFPEGRRSRTGELLPAQPGIGLLVLKTSCIVIPTYVHGTFDLWTPGKKFPSLFGHRTACVFGSPLYFGEYVGKNKKETQQEIADEIMQAIKKLQEWYLDGAKGSPP